VDAHLGSSAKRLMAWLAPMAAGVLAQCFYGISAPDPRQYALVTNTMQLEADSMYRALGSRVSDAVEAADTSFRSAAAIDFAWYRTDSLRDTTWGDPANYFADYERFSEVQRDTANYAFGTFLVRGPALGTYGCGDAVTLGVTISRTSDIDNPNYESSWPRADLLSSFVFAGTSDEWSGACFLFDGTVPDRQYVFIHVLVHELGHLRAGLTHVAENPEYHGGQGVTPKPPRWDVMYKNINNSDLKYKYPYFDFLDDTCPNPVGLRTRTCRDNLCNWRSVTR